MRYIAIGRSGTVGPVRAAAARWLAPGLLAGTLALILYRGGVEGKPRIRALSLTDNVSIMTAISNDVSYEKVFTEQLRVFLEEGDVVLGITASGNSPNILDAIRYAREHGATTIGFIGFGGGKLKALVDVNVTVSSRNYGHVEDLYCILEHLISQCLRQKIAGA